MATRDKEASRGRILEAACRLLRDRGAGNLTVDAVAKAAGCAKGLVHYHYKTKRGLLEAAAAHFSSEREGQWSTAFDTPSPKDAIDRSWRLLTDESASGVLRGWTSLFTTESPLADSTVKKASRSFATALGHAASDLMRQQGMAPAIPASEIGWLLGAVVNGIGFELASGADRKELEGAYAAAWLGLLSLFAPAAPA